MARSGSFPWFSLSIIAIAFVVIGFLSVRFSMLKSRENVNDIFPETPAVIELPILDEAIELAADEEQDEPAVKMGTSEPIVTEAKPQLPPLHASDTYLKTEITKLSGGNKLLALLVNDELIRKSVRMVHGLSENFVVKEFRPVQSPKGQFEVSATGRKDANGSPYYQISPDNLARYAPYIDLLDAVSPEQAAELYQHFYPLLQDAYAELGLRDSRFQDVVLKALGNLSENKVDQTDLTLKQPSVMYMFADESLEASSGVQKLKLRLGDEGYQKLKSWSQELAVLIQ